MRGRGRFLGVGVVHLWHAEEGAFPGGSAEVCVQVNLSHVLPQQRSSTSIPHFLKFHGKTLGFLERSPLLPGFTSGKKPEEDFPLMKKVEQRALRSASVLGRSTTEAACSLTTASWEPLSASSHRHLELCL